MPETKPEHLGWRDAALSERHRLWGFDAPATDIDLLLLEYNYAKPVALVEYKHKNTKEPDPGQASYRALVDLADGYKDGPLPCFIAIYDPDFWRFRVIALNSAAKEYYRDTNQVLSERSFVKTLYLMRRHVLTRKDIEVLNKLNGIYPYRTD